MAWSALRRKILSRRSAAVYARHPASSLCVSCRWDTHLLSALWSVLPRILAREKSKKPGWLPEGKKVAIIGSGPPGMSAAYYLAKMNLSVTIFEAAHEPGGLLRYAVPEFRLPQKVLDEQFTQLKSLGVEIQTDVVFGRTMLIDELFMQGFAAVLLATGASLPVFSCLPGSSLTGVYYDREFLYRLQTTGKEDALAIGRQQSISAPKTLVGRGRFYAARLSVRLGLLFKLSLKDSKKRRGLP